MTTVPSLEEVLRLVSYNPETGEVTLNPRLPSDFNGNKNPERDAKAFNKRYAGKPCWTALNAQGQRQSVILNWHSLAHRVVWWMHYGEMPDEVWAIDGDYTNLKIGNLRHTSRLYSGKSTTMHKDNTSGVRGVHWEAGRNRFRAEIKANGKSHYLGRYRTLERAAEARRDAEKKFGFKVQSPNG